MSAQILGSVSHFALNHCRIPVLIVHDESDALDDLGPDAGAAADGEQATNAEVMPAV